MTTIDEFIKKNNLRMEVRKTFSNPSMDAGKYEMNHYEIKIIKNNNSFVTHYSMGLGLKYTPKITGVIDCLAMEASGVENEGTFENWCDSFGYDTDSRKAERIWETIKIEAKQLKTLLGQEAYNELLNCVERL